MIGGYLSGFLSDSVSFFLGGAVLGTDLAVIDEVKRSSSSDIESNILPILVAKENTHKFDCIYIYLLIVVGNQCI